ncbi:MULTISPECIES: LPXTG cell wall anchor domain-containing protein [Streptomyces]|uniref:LPXTG cell wall anchor domain-containing protein n=1 Tax=Streptomyces TaxID=1883 RepID=UPI002FDBBB51
MSIARRVIGRRLLGAGAASLALCAATAAAAPGAWAHGSGGDGWNSGGSYRPGTGAGTRTATDRCEFSLDGTHFTASVKVDDQNLKVTGDGKAHITVRAADDATTCTASLASYLAHGPSFATSGEQVFVDFDTVTVKPGATDTLDIAVPDAGCFAQIDLYRGAVKFDGKHDANDGFEHGDLPKGPDRPVIKDKLIAAWNGGTKDCTTEPPATEEPPTTPPAEPSEPATDEPSTPADESTPPASDTPSTQAPSPEPSDSASAAAPSPNGGGDLAQTGGSSATGPIALGAVVLVAGGAAFVVASKRRRSARS